MAYGQIQGHAQHHKAKAAHHTKMAKHHHAIAGEHEKMAAHHGKMAGEGVGGGVASETDEGEGMDEDQDTVQNSHVMPMSFGRGGR